MAPNFGWRYIDIYIFYQLLSSKEAAFKKRPFGSQIPSNPKLSTGSNIPDVYGFQNSFRKLKKNKFVDPSE